MSRKDYVMIAAEIERKVRHWHGSDGAAALRDLARGLAADFKQDNVRFDRERFLTACGIDE